MAILFGLSKYMILNMQRHGAHHENPTAPYQELRYDEKGTNDAF